MVGRERIKESGRVFKSKDTKEPYIYKTHTKKKKKKKNGREVVFSG